MNDDHEELSFTHEIHLHGFPICPGIAIGKPLLFSLIEEPVPEFKVAEHEIDQEIARYHHALKHSKQDVLVLREQLAIEGATDGVAILGSHLEMMQDPEMTKKVEEQIRATGKNTEFIFNSVIDEYEEKFNKITDEFFRNRVKDIQDISRRVIGHLKRSGRKSLASLPHQTVLFAHELSPSDTAEADTDNIFAFVTRAGGETSHVAIMARSKGIPFVSNVDFPEKFLTKAKSVIVDGRCGEVVVNPTRPTTNYYRNEQKRFHVSINTLKSAIHRDAETVDGYRVHLSANIENLKDVDVLVNNGGEGVGLFRSEYIFLSKESFPQEEEQFQIYRTLVERMAQKPTVIRVFDIGGDKFGQFFANRYEANPYLGCRAIRYLLKERTLFKNQLRAILRASHYGNVKILLPMISGLPELMATKELIESIKAELTASGIPFAPSIPLGCMIEVPSAAITTDILIKECDFLSIGTNDLIQYSLAVDRGNPSLSYLYNPAHPSIIRFIRMIVQESERAGKTVSICGEIAADPRFTSLLLGLGVCELSVAPRHIPLLKNTIRQLEILESHYVAETVLGFSTAEEIEEYLDEEFKKIKTLE